VSIFTRLSSGCFAECQICARLSAGGPRRTRARAERLWGRGPAHDLLELGARHRARRVRSVSTVSTVGVRRTWSAPERAESDARVYPDHLHLVPDRSRIRLLLVVPARPRYLDGPRARPRSDANHRGVELLHVLAATDHSIRTVIPVAGRDDVLDAHRCRDTVLPVIDSEICVLRLVRHRGLHHAAGFDVAPHGVAAALLLV